DGSFLGALVLSIGGLWGLRKAYAAPLVAVVLASVGQAAVAAGVLSGLITGVSPDWWPLVGMPGNLMACVGMIWLGVWAWRARAVSRWVVPMFVLTLPVGVGLAEFGGSIITAALWCTLGAYMLRTRN